MTEGAGVNRAGAARAEALPLVAAFGALAALTVSELVVAGLAVGYAARIGALAVLLATKVGLLLTFFMRARASWRASRMTLVSIGFAVSVIVVLVLETLYRASVH
jgi:heme/copper-type cytochrome/quinol oxidase subunit 4